MYQQINFNIDWAGKYENVLGFLEFKRNLPINVVILCTIQVRFYFRYKRICIQIWFKFSIGRVRKRERERVSDVIRFKSICQLRLILVVAVNRYTYFTVSQLLNKLRCGDILEVMGFSSSFCENIINCIIYCLISCQNIHLNSKW